MPLFCHKMRQNKDTPQGYCARFKAMQNHLTVHLYFIEKYDKIEATGETIIYIRYRAEIGLWCAYILSQNVTKHRPQDR
jgi:hypothetical protein